MKINCQMKQQQQIIYANVYRNTINDGFILLASLKFLISSLWVDFQDKGIYNQKVNTELLY